MLKPKTHFERVPLELVKKIAEKEIKQEKTTEHAQETKNKGCKENV